MIEIPSRWSGNIISRSETAATMAEAVAELVTLARERGEHANLSEANLRGLMAPRIRVIVPAWSARLPSCVIVAMTPFRGSRPIPIVPLNGSLWE